MAEAAPARLPYLTMLAFNVVIAKTAVYLPLFPLGGLLLAAAGCGRLVARYQDADSTDELTGLLNRRHFFDLAADRLAFEARDG